MAKILIIEDEDSIAQLERDYLEFHQFECDVASNGMDGYRMALSGAYDLILLDIMLPGMDGYELCRKLRDEVDIPILMVTAKTEDMDKIKGLGLGTDDYIVKPFNPNELVARVKTHIARYRRLTRKDEGNVIRVKGLVVDRAARKVWVCGEEKPLTAKEFDLLAFLASHPDKVFSKEHLFERVWGLDAMGDVSTVTVHIRKIREKIETDPSNPAYIETVWGVGYRFKH